MESSICLKCCRIICGNVSECCGNTMVEFVPQEHASLLIGKSNAWNIVWSKWEMHPKMREVVHDLAERGCNSAPTALNEFIERLIENQI